MYCIFTIVGANTVVLVERLRTRTVQQRFPKNCTTHICCVQTKQMLMHLEWLFALPVGGRTLLEAFLARVDVILVIVRICQSRLGIDDIWTELTVFNNGKQIWSSFSI